MRAVVTGATGFIGSYLVKELVENGHEVIAVVRPGSVERMKTEGIGITVVQCDLSEIESLPDQIGVKCDWFFHLAWEGVSGLKQSDFSLQTKNVISSVTMVKIAKELCCLRFIGAGSIFEVECIHELETTDTPSNYSLVYKTAKLYAHYNCKIEAAKLGIDFLWPLIINAYGPYEIKPRFMSTLIYTLLCGEEPCLTTGEQLYDFIYVTDATRAFRLIAEKGVSNQKYIIGSGNVKPLKEYIIQVRDIVSPNSSLGFGKYKSKGVSLELEELDISNLVQDTGFTPLVSFKDGVRHVKNSMEIKHNLSF